MHLVQALRTKYVSMSPELLNWRSRERGRKIELIFRDIGQADDLGAWEGL